MLSNDNAPKAKLFTDKQLGLAAILGGPIPPGILFYLNYKRIDKDKEAYVALTATLIFATALFVTIIKAPAEIMDKIPNAAFNALYGLIIYFAYKKFLAKEIEEKLNAGHEKASNWTVAGVVVIGIVVSIAVIFGLAANEPAFQGEKATFGKAQSEIFYDPGTTTREDVDKLGSILMQSGFFTDENTMAVHLNMEQEVMIVTFQIDAEYWETEEVIEYFSALKNDLQEVFEREVSVVLQSYDLSGKTKEKRF